MLTFPSGWLLEEEQVGLGGIKDLTTSSAGSRKKCHENGSSFVEPSLFFRGSGPPLLVAETPATAITKNFKKLIYLI